MKSQGEIEAAICEGISRFEQEYMGRGAATAISKIIAVKINSQPLDLFRLPPLSSSGSYIMCEF